MKKLAILSFLVFFYITPVNAQADSLLNRVTQYLHQTDSLGQEIDIDFIRSFYHDFDALEPCKKFELTQKYLIKYYLRCDHYSNHSICVLLCNQWKK